MSSLRWMRRVLLACGVCLFWAGECGAKEVVPAPKALKPSLNLYVGLNGRDSWSGRLEKPARNDSDGPFATPGAARDAIRRLKAEGGVPAGGVTVWIAGGVYELGEPFALSEADSGREGAPVVYRGRGGEARLLGGKVLGALTPLTDSAVLERLEAPARNQVRVLDLKAAGITRYGKLAVHCSYGPARSWGMELFFARRPMAVARWPNAGWDIIDGVPMTTPQTSAVPGAAATKPSRVPDQFIYSGDRPRRWVGLEDAWVHGYWMWEWDENCLNILSIDPGTRIIQTRPAKETKRMRQHRHAMAQ